MSSNEHLLDHFSASTETRQLGAQILRLAHVKTRPGSGRELKNYQVGLPAACMLIACEQLNTTEVTQKSAQTAACLTLKEFKKVYDIVKTILAEQEQASNYSYLGLHSDHDTDVKLDVINSFLTEVENEIMQSGYTSSNLTKCSAYFWTVNCIKPRALASTELFALNYDLSLKKFINILNMLNDHCKLIRKKIQSELKTVIQSPSKSTATSTPRRRELITNESPLKAPTSTPNDTSPVRRSSRTSSAVRDISLSPAKKSAPLPWRKVAPRELPTNDSPRRTPKQAPGTQIVDVEMDYLPETPSKRRKLESPTRLTSESTFLTALATPGSSRVLKELSYKKGGLRPTQLFPTTTTARSLKRKQDADAVFEEYVSFDESEGDVTTPRRRFRPVCLEHQQWNMLDPRLVKIWKQVEKQRTVPLFSSSKPPISRSLRLGLS
ncbi:hypothetical protein CPB83DRAFT_859306 [Crepidotus variabilis]|uniref:Origin recognition complex subunit 6 n=1 Tax=Crepidotus variabilis TaxID=179855 RepID=A0A9P6EAU4_9AGAR|nr:hypothetical protein CPB83DRAFT_859306 [Crepidotus variabilis]